MSEERDYSDTGVRAEVMDDFHAEGWGIEARQYALWNICEIFRVMRGSVLQFVGQKMSEPLEDLVHAAETVHAANMSEDFDVAYDAIVAACEVLVSNPSPAHLLGFVYGMHRATLAAEEVHYFWSALERIDLLATEEEEE